MKEYFRVFDCTSGRTDFLSLTGIAKLAKVSEDTVKEYVDMDKKLRNKYLISSLEYTGKVEDARTVTEFDTSFKREWDQLCNMFHRKVRWVKTGGRKLFVAPEQEEEENNGEE